MEEAEEQKSLNMIESAINDARDKKANIHTTTKPASLSIKHIGLTQWAALNIYLVEHVLEKERVQDAHGLDQLDKRAQHDLGNNEPDRHKQILFALKASLGTLVAVATELATTCLARSDVDNLADEAGIEALETIVLEGFGMLKTSQANRYSRDVGGRQAHPGSQHTSRPENTRAA